MNRDGYISAICIFIVSICLALSLLSSFVESFASSYVYERQQEEEEWQTTGSSILATLDAMRVDLEQATARIEASQKAMEAATEVQVEAANQAFIANQAFVEWAIQNGFIQEVEE